MSKIKVSELFNSIQGEGRYAGVPSLFLRTFGCNFRCPGFGRDHSVANTPNDEVIAIIKKLHDSDYEGKTFAELPLVETGCDTYAAVYPEFKHLSPMMDVVNIVKKMKETLPHGSFHKEQHLVITGGEPLLPGWQRSYIDLIDELYKQKVAIENELFITFETNGTQMIDRAMASTLQQDSNLHFCVSPKMMASGESIHEAIRPDVVSQYLDYGIVDFKFVVDTEDGVQEIIHVLHSEFKDVWRDPRFGSVYLMPVGGTNEGYMINQGTVAQLAINNGMRFSPRLQCSVFGNQWAT